MTDLFNMTHYFNSSFLLQFFSVSDIESSLGLFRAYQALQAVIVIILTYLGIKTVKAKSSKIQNANLIVILHSSFLMIGYFIEQSTMNLDVMQAGIKVQYFGQCGVMLSSLWLMDLFCGKKINKYLYYAELMLWAVILAAVFNFELGGFFYRSMNLKDFGTFATIRFKPGILYYICYISNTFILGRIQYLCYKKMKKSTGIERKRCYWIMLGPSFPMIFTVLKWTGLTNGFDMMTFGLLGFVCCLTQAIVKYDYLDSVQIETELDPLTNVSNRNYFVNYMKALLKNGVDGSFFMLDMDNFKYVNDTFGHGMGDKALMLFGDTLNEVLSEEHLAARIGGDEFCLFLQDVTDKEELNRFACKIKSVYFEKQQKEKFPCELSCSIGIYIVCNKHEETFEKLYENADKALYLAKNSGKCQWRFYK